MKLLYITNAINGSGGLERVLSLKTAGLIEQFNYEVHILTLNNGAENSFFEFHPAVKMHDIIVKGNALKYFFNYFRGIQQVIKLVNPQVISVCDDGVKGFLFPILFGKNISVIYERHATVLLNFDSINKLSFFYKWKNYFQRWLMLYGASKFNEFVVLTHGNKNEWPNINCRVIPNMNPFSSKIINNEKDKIVLAVGSQSSNKGYDRLVRIWKIVNQSYPDWVLKIYGKQNDNLNLQQLIEGESLSSTIILNHPVKNIEPIYNEAAIFVLTSHSEGFGMVLIEAMNYGVPCIAFDCPYGPADIISNGLDGYLIENGDIEGFANKLLELIKDEELRKSMGQLAQNNVIKYNLNSILPIWDELFKNLMK